MHEDYYTLTAPEPCTVLGLELRALTLGHVLLLHRLGSVFVTPESSPSPLGGERAGERGAPDDFQELALAVALCAQSHADGAAMLEDVAGTSRAMAVWGLKLTRQTGWDRLLRRKPCPIPLAAEWEKFSAWLKTHTAVPHYEFKADDMRDVHCPEAQIVKAALQRAFGFSDAVMLDRSWALCLWDYVTLKAIDGQVQMTNPQEVQDALAVGQRIAAALAKKGGQVNGVS